MSSNIIVSGDDNQVELFREIILDVDVNVLERNKKYSCFFKFYIDNEFTIVDRGRRIAPRSILDLPDLYDGVVCEICFCTRCTLGSRDVSCKKQWNIAFDNIDDMKFYFENKSPSCYFCENINNIVFVIENKD